METPASTVPTDERIVSNQTILDDWDGFKKQRFDVLLLSTTGIANGFLVRFTGRPDSDHQPDRQGASRAMTEKCLNFSMQRRCLLMRQFDSKIMSPKQDPDQYMKEVHQLRDEVEHIGETFSETRIMYLILEGLTDDYEQIRFAAERDPDISLKEIEVTIRNMYVDRMARGAARRHAEGGVSQHDGVIRLPG